MIKNVDDGKYDNLVTITPEEREGKTEEEIQDLIKKKVIRLIASVNPDRPMPQNAPHTPTLNYPLDQYLYSPIKICGNFYDPETEELLDPENWDVNSEKILLTSAATFKKNGGLGISVTYSKDDREPVYIDGVKYIQQNCGYLAGTIGAMDGGVVGEEPLDPIVKRPSAIDLHLSLVVTKPYDDIRLDSLPSSLENFYFFLNGRLLYPNVDYVISEDGIVSFSTATLEYGDRIYAFENLIDVERGCLKNRLRIGIAEETKRIFCEGIEPDSTLLPFYDGYLVFQTDFIAQEGSVRFVNTLEEGNQLDITECLFSPESKLEVVFAGSSNFSSSYLSVQGIDEKDTLLVFSDGKLLMENVEYKIQKNVIAFLDGLVLDVNKKLMVLRV